MIIRYSHDPDHRGGRLNTASRLVTLATVALSASCLAGDGSSLDDGGRSLKHPYFPSVGSRLAAPAPLGDGASGGPTYDQIASQIFAPYCVSCHAGANAPKGLDLTPALAFDKLVGKTSVQKKKLMLVAPQKPDESYLIHKLEGGPALVGRRMPRNRPSRPQTEIDRIRAWIAAGAKRNTTDE